MTRRSATGSALTMTLSSPEDVAGRPSSARSSTLPSTSARRSTRRSVPAASSGAWNTSSAVSVSAFISTMSFAQRSRSSPSTAAFSSRSTRRVSGVRRSCDIATIIRPRTPNCSWIWAAIRLNTSAASRTSRVPWGSSSRAGGSPRASAGPSAADARTQAGHQAREPAPSDPGRDCQYEQPHPMVEQQRIRWQTIGRRAMVRTRGGSAFQQRSAVRSRAERRSRLARHRRQG